jgi:hypothetical protein
MFSYYISETSNWLKNYLKIPTNQHLSNISKNEENIIVFAALTYYEKIVPKISVSTEYDVFDHRFPNVQFNNHKCITIFLHCNIRTIKEDIDYINEQYLNYLMPQ